MSCYYDYIEKARAILTDAGILFEPLDCSGDMAYRGTTHKPHSTTGRYIIHLDDRPRVWFCNRHNGDDEHGQVVNLYSNEEWQAMTEADKEALRERILQEKEEAQRQREERAQEAARAAKNLWAKCHYATEENAYLSRKGVIPMGDMMSCDASATPLPDALYGECLVLPLLNSEGETVSLQFIAGDGTKRFLQGGEKKGCFFPIPAKDGGKSGPLLIGEGVATVLSCCMATGFAGLVAFDAGNLLPVAEVARQKYPDRVVILCADNDIREDGKTNTGVLKATEAAQAIGAKLAICPAVNGKKADFNDLHAAEGLDRVREYIEVAMKGDSAAKKSKYRCLNIAELIDKQLPPRQTLLSPIFAVQSLSMVYAMRGVGKTHFALSCAYAVASGGGVFGRWFAPHPARVLYIDGEMPEVTMQERLRAIAIGSDSDITEPDNFRIFTPDEQETAMPNLATKEGQEAIEPFLDGVSLVVVDNIATLARTGKANDEDSWNPVQSWLLDLRRRGISVLLVHHAGKNGTQRGTGAKEDILDTVIELKRPSDYRADEGARFEVHFSKARGLYGEDVEPFEAMLAIDEFGQCSWTTRKVEDVMEQRVCELLEAGFSERDIVDELKSDNVGRTRVRTIKKKLEARGKSFTMSKGGASTHKTRY